MKKLFLFLLTFISLNVFSQNDYFKVKDNSFHKIDGYTEVDKHYDVNNQPMALIKISTENINAQERKYITFKGNLATDFNIRYESSEIYLYLSTSATFIEIHHPDYGKTEFSLPYKLDDFGGYEMVLSYIPIISPAIKQKYHLIVSADQPNALIYIDDEPIDVKEASRLFDEGTTHFWKIECDLYHTETGTLTLNERTVISKELRPNFGYIDVTTSPKQAKVFVDGKYIGLSPIKTDKLRSGSYNVKVMKDMYKMEEHTYVVNDGQVTSADINMTNNSVEVTINTDAESDIYIDEEYKAKGRWTGMLSEGSHIFEARKTDHRTNKQNVELVLGEHKIFTLDAPVPLCGSCEINTSPMGAEIYIDGINYGQTPNYINQLIVGKHELKLEKFGYVVIAKTITIADGKMLSIDEKLETDKEVVIPSEQSYDMSYDETSSISEDNQQYDVSKSVENDKVKDGVKETIIVNGVSFKMIKVEGGTFKMGATSEQGNDAEIDEELVHLVTLSDYYIGETEVTQELWQAVMGTTVCQQRDKVNKNWTLRGVGDDFPMYYINWNDCQEFIEKLNQLTGMNFRLPTESEWEYAARGGNKSKGYKYSGSNRVSKGTWYEGNSRDVTHNVKTKSPNELGIYDMSGNVWEWCHDWYGDYDVNLKIDPKGPASGSFRVLRGGGWSNYARSCRVSDRNRSNIWSRDAVSGFRLAL